MPITYNYSDCSISHFALKRIDGSCRHKDAARTTLIGVFCKGCGHFNGSKGDFVICGHPNQTDDAGAEDIRREIHKELEYRALCALDY